MISRTIIACLPPPFVLVAGLLVASRVGPILLAWPWRLGHRSRHVAGDTTTSFFDSEIFVGKYAEENRFPSGQLECAKICDA